MVSNSVVLEKIAQYKKEGIQRIKFGITTMDGVLQGKYIPLEKFASIAGSTGGFCDCIFAWDVEDQLYDNTSFSGWHTGYPDALFKLDILSERRLKDENNLPFFIADLVDNDGQSLHPICPRNLLKRILAKAKDMGYSVKLGFEYEFSVFSETPNTVREKNFQSLNSLTPGNFGYSILRSSTYADLFNDFMDYCTDLRIPLEGVHCETGPGIWEAGIIYDEALEAADRAALFKTFSKVFFQKKGLISTFMAKWSMKYAGQGGHVHQSLFDAKTGKPLFYDAKARGNMSEIMIRYLAGQLEYLKPFLVMSAPTINSYTRLVKGAWAPTCATWGMDNRTVALRVVPGTETSHHLEHRVPGADANPYLAAASIVAAGLLGIEQRLELGKETKGNAYEAQAGLPEKLQFPTNLRDSFRNLAQSGEAEKMFGREFLDHFVASREWEARQYETMINDWQMQRYFEII